LALRVSVQIIGCRPAAMVGPDARLQGQNKI
jgi:hypothetical protein